MKTLVVVVIYPSVIKYLPQLIHSLNNQSKRDFSIIFFNDGVTDSDGYFSELQIPFQLADVIGTPNQIRFEALRRIKADTFENIVFQDADDMMSENRVEVCVKYLADYDLICNDMDLMDQQGSIFKKGIWSERLSNGFLFDYSFIQNENIVGLGNTAIKKSILNFPLLQSVAEPLAADWFIFYQILATGRSKALFTNECKTIYRQHSENTAGLGAITEQRLQQACRVKMAHYEALNEIGYNFHSVLQELKEACDKHVGSIKANSITSLFWWEETKLINEKN